MEAKERTVVTYTAKNGHDEFDEWLGVTELKIDVGPGYRVYFGQLGDIVVLLNGGNKSTQDRDIKEAKRLWSEFKSREVQ